MTDRPPPLPWLLLALDAFGALLVVLGLLALSGFDFGRPVLVRAAPALIVIGAALMVPLVVWAVRGAAARRRLP